MDIMEREVAEVSNYILQQMKDGADEWYMPWHCGLEEPFNVVTGKVFTGQNAAILWTAASKRGYERNKWATLRQWNSRKSGVRLGAKGVRLFLPKFEGPKKAAKADPERITRFIVFHVFNVEEVTNYNPDHPDLFFQFDTDPQIEDFAIATKARLNFGGERACYIPKYDLIEMPLKEKFIETPHGTAEEGFYATLVHELVHWSGVKGRSERKGNFNEQHKDYAFEELVAELGAALICTRFSNKNQPRADHAAYLKGWLDVLSSDFSIFYKALAEAQRAVHWLYMHTDMYPKEWVHEASDKSDDEDALHDIVAFDDITPSLADQDEVSKPTLSKQCQEFEVLGERFDFESTLRVRVICGHCESEYKISLTRYEVASSCMICEKRNKHEIDW